MTDRNPKIVCGSVATHNGRILLVRRAIEPRRGSWTLPAGFLESGESAWAGAAREAREEANADLEMTSLLAVYSVPHISQIHLVFAADLLSPDVSAGVESEEVGLFSWGDVPWEHLAFPTTSWALMHFDALQKAQRRGPQRFGSSGAERSSGGGDGGERSGGGGDGGGRRSCDSDSGVAADSSMSVMGEAAPPFGNPSGDDVRWFWSPHRGLFLHPGFDGTDH